MPWHKPAIEDIEQVQAAIRRTRERRGLTMADLDRRLTGKSGNTTRQIEGGHSAPSVAMLFKLARALDCNWTDLLGPPPSGGEDAEWRAGYRAGVGDAVGAVRGLVDGKNP